MTTRSVAKRAIGWMALLLTMSIAPSFAQTVRVEAETYLPNPASGPNQTDIAGTGSIVGFYVSWDWLAYDVMVPEDGLYTITIRYGAGWGTWFQNPSPSPAIPAEPIPVVFSFYTSGQQAFPDNVMRTLLNGNPNWSAYTELTLANGGTNIQVPLKAGLNRVVVQIRPDNAIDNRFGSGMNFDWFELTKVGAYPDLATISGTVNLALEGSNTPAENAYVSAGTEPYMDAPYVTTTDADGNYTLYVPPGEHPVKAFVNGYATGEATVTAPATQDFTLTWNGRVEAEEFIYTNPGPGDAAGLQSAYATDRSNRGVLWLSRNNANNPSKIAYYEITVPEAGVYEISMNYTSWKIDTAIGYGRYLLSANDGPAAELRFIQTMTDLNSAEIYQDSGTVLYRLEKGVNSLLLNIPDAGSLAEVDYFTITPVTVPAGTLVVEVVNSDGNTPIQGATVNITDGDATVDGIAYSGATGPNGRIEIPVPPGSYQVSATTPTAAGTGTASGDVTADQTTTLTIPLTLTAIAVEAENNVAQGPGTPAVTILNTTAASGGQAITSWQANDRPEWVEWVVDVPQSGLYEMTLRYARVASPGEHTVNIWSTTYQVKVDQLPFSGAAGAFGDYTYEAPVPLVEGENRFRITLAPVFGGSVNLDYIKFTRVGNLPNLVTITGRTLGTNGSATAPVAHALVTTTSPFNPFGGETAAYSDFNGDYTLYVTADSYSVTASANGYTAATAGPVTAPGTLDITMQTNLANGLQIEPEKAPVISTNLKVSGDEITNGGPNHFIELPISVPQAGLYDVSILYSSGWAPTDGNPVITRWTVNGLDYTIQFPTTTAWTDYTTDPVSIGTLPLNAGPNMVRMTFVAKSANIKHMVLTRTGALPTTDIDGNGTTDILDAVLYNRRLNGLDAGPAPDLNGDGASNQQDVKRILLVTGGLQS